MRYTLLYMNTKVLLGIVAALVILVAGYFVLRPAPGSAPAEIPTQTNASSTSATSSPTLSVGTSTVKIARANTQFDPSSLISTSAYPTITGTANVPLITIVISNSKGVGIVGTSDVPVVQGHWSYPCSVALPPGNYILTLYVNKTVTAGAELTVNKKS